MKSYIITTTNTLKQLTLTSLPKEKVAIQMIRVRENEISRTDHRSNLRQKLHFSLKNINFN